jgi:predicted dehydrogenase
LVAVAARDAGRAREFAEKWGYPDARAYGSYEELAGDDNVDVIYVATINPKHDEQVKLFLEAGKNVLCEKPLAMNLKETRRMVALAKLKGVFFMEAMWSRCLPAHRKLKEEIDAGTSVRGSLTEFKLSKSSI